MSIPEMRHAISKVYKNSITWPMRVSQMPQEQVVAIYYSFLKRGKLKG